MYRSLTASVLSGDRPSQYSEQLLTRLGLMERFDTDPEIVLAALRGPGEGLTREYLFVLSELIFLSRGEEQQARVLSRLRRVRVGLRARPDGRGARRPASTRACGWRRTSTTSVSPRGSRCGDDATVVLDPGPRPLPFGQIEISVDEKMLLWSSYRMTRFVSSASSKCAASSTVTVRPASVRRSPRSSPPSAPGLRPRRRASGFPSGSRCR